MIVQVPDLVVSYVLVAVMVTDPVAPVPIVTSPLEFTVTLSELLDQVTVFGAKFVLTTSALNCIVDPTAPLAVEGSTVTLVIVGAPGTNATALWNGEIENVFQV